MSYLPRCLLIAAVTLSVWAGSASAAILEQISPAPAIYIPQIDFDVMFASATGDVTALVVGIDVVSIPSSTSGCEASDFATFPSGSIAVMQRGTCGFAVKTANAEAAGAVGALIFNFPLTELLFGSVALNPPNIPVMGLTQALGLQLAQSGVPITVRMQVTSADVGVPEPSTLGLIGLGLLGLGAMKRRRRYR